MSSGYRARVNPLAKQFEVQMRDENRKAAAQELLEILMHHAERSGAKSAQMLRVRRQRLAPLATLTSDEHLQAIIAELDSLAAKLEPELELGA